MPRPRIQIAPHLTYAEIIHCLETCQDSKAKNYWTAIQLLSHPTEPMTVEQVAAMLGYSTDWVRKLAGRYNRLGSISLSEKRRNLRKRSSTTF
ncbi:MULTISPECIES: helix-turn-helix domain-containing protein [Leptolyngbya]|jgi:transposase|uniref:Uncharacterized protein n=2 Tax=Leptolyngbya boryana TaxID=1184 RepID=A0A1Z4J971_LEPBY|nr:MULTISPECIES: helix-turn-helix domain-containing protein [Leptolyngbya]BAY53253.1 hypothetical protein NIES2135_00550 [Leptolyngbya boryana NIES-2135]MBD1855028.1 helix-turn-helix domain-containing protein [Leptolyngbya sp. FACHB-1624]MBD2366875.1 helix-turn-helix domain-containing protein [Leptolyngbya sp. FACHB-161]MBD2373111.1 helix-turn-helix domain-containing protein [Leptolyngbya sp. FACHB-238]MBD2397512.1 helix-turn-helix domain-containing protein [Leptolyngbya sp. FACHB-239]